MSNFLERTYLILAYNYLNDKSDYLYCDNKSQLKNKCNEIKEDGFDIMFAGRIVVEEDCTAELR